MDEQEATQHRDKKKPSRRLVVGLCAAVLAILVIGGVLIYRGMSQPVRLSKIELTDALSSRATNAEIQERFAYEEPVMLRFEYEAAKIGVAVRFEVINEKGTVVKSGSTTVLCETEGCETSGQRHISIVNTGSTILPQGHYRVTLSANQPERGLGAIEFRID